jgi:hypothetical protein
LGVTRAANTGVAVEVATLGLGLAAGADDRFSGSTAADAAATIAAPTALAMSFLRVWVMATMYSLDLSRL